MGTDRNYVVYGKYLGIRFRSLFLKLIHAQSNILTVLSMHNWVTAKRLLEFDYEIESLIHKIRF